MAVVIVTVWLILHPMETTIKVHQIIFLDQVLLPHPMKTRRAIQQGESPQIIFITPEIELANPITN